MNIFGAFAHLAADGVRGIAVLFAGILAVAGVVDAAKADAYCSLFVCLFVLAAAFTLLRTVLRKSTPTAYEEIEDEQACCADNSTSISGTAAIRPAAPTTTPGAKPAATVLGQRSGGDSREELGDAL
mmetsp:Transcript_19271/g.62775  ORF Transcript_19271/g.62775 Transcript_19271/m.62775 type:complete len:127 (-) Transcript_19271:25-405(-)